MVKEKKQYDFFCKFASSCFIIIFKHELTYTLDMITWNIYAMIQGVMSNTITETCLAWQVRAQSKRAVCARALWKLPSVNCVVNTWFVSCDHVYWFSCQGFYNKVLAWISFCLVSINLHNVSLLKLYINGLVVINSSYITKFLNKSF